VGWLCGGRVVGSESLLLVAGIGGYAGASAIMALAKTNTHVLMTLPLFAIGGGLMPAARTLLAKMIPKEQTARLFSVVSLLMVICPLGSRVLFNEVYRQTMDSWTGFVFVLMAAIYMVMAGGQIFVHLLMRPLWIEQMHSEDEGPPAISAFRPSEEESGASTDSGDSVSVQAIVDFGGDGRQ